MFRITPTLDKTCAAFLIPGDLNTLTGGYTYDRRLIETLSESDTPLHHVALDASWPDPTPSALAEVSHQLDRLPDAMPVILDGLVFGAMPTEILARQSRPVISMLHHPLGLEAGLAPERARALLALEKDNLRHAAHVIVTSPHTRAVAMNDFAVPPERIAIALPGFDRPDVVPDFLKLTTPLILSVGTICERKGHDILLAALERVAHLSWRSVIAGKVLDPALYDALHAQRDAAGLAGRVEFAGEVPRHDLNRLYSEAHIFALATRYEGYGMVLSEAQLYSLPILSCAVGAVPQTVPDGSAILTPPDDPAAFAAGLERLLTDQNEHSRLAAESRWRAQTLPRWTDTAAIVQTVLQTVMSQGAHGM
jgi:glycosyltransferase involved in cell wall biosynthesis